mmetsp:Transcript_76003/g.220754  ORF Transcript_76003/g.220754 Transcript_76003/m.220754 type:complete len:209 (+) Transcript_76003:373-999(+)
MCSRSPGGNPSAVEPSSKRRHVRQVLHVPEAMLREPLRGRTSGMVQQSHHEVCAVLQRGLLPAGARGPCQVSDRLPRGLRDVGVSRPSDIVQRDLPALLDERETFPGPHWCRRGYPCRRIRRCRRHGGRRGQQQNQHHGHPRRRKTRQRSCPHGAACRRSRSRRPRAATAGDSDAITEAVAKRHVRPSLPSHCRDLLLSRLCRLGFQK